MKRRFFLNSMITAGWSIANVNLAQAIDGARALMVENRDVPGLKEFEIKIPGQYFLTGDQIQAARFRYKESWMSPTGGFMLNISCGSVELDLRGYTLGADLEMSGVALQAKFNQSYVSRYPGRYGAASLDSRFVTLRNGTLDFARGNGTGIAVMFSSVWHDLYVLTAGRPRRNRIPMQHISYERNEYRFEQLRVLATDVAMVVEGSHTVIRDCVIESADIAAICTAGDHVTIENCEIRLRKSFKKQIGVARAAIVLRDGSHAVIRNNRIRVDYSSDDRDEMHCILVRDGATNVLIEGNTFINIKGDPVTLTEGSQAIIRENKVAQAWF